MMQTITCGSCSKRAEFIWGEGSIDLQTWMMSSFQSVYGVRDGQSLLTLNRSLYLIFRNVLCSILTLNAHFQLIKSQNDILYSGSATLSVHMFEPNEEVKRTWLNSSQRQNHIHLLSHWSRILHINSTLNLPSVLWWTPARLQSCT